MHVKESTKHQDKETNVTAGCYRATLKTKLSFFLLSHQTAWKKEKLSHSYLTSISEGNENLKLLILNNVAFVRLFFPDFAKYQKKPATTKTTLLSRLDTFCDSRMLFL